MRLGRVVLACLLTLVFVAGSPVAPSVAPAAAATAWGGTLELSVAQAQVDANSPTTQMTVALSEHLTSPYFLTVYDNTGRRVHTCAPGYTCATGSTFSVTTPNNETRTYTAYVSQDQPTTGPAVVDVRATASVQVTNAGWGGTVGMSVDRTEVDANNTTTQMTLTLSKPVVSPYFLSVYDDTGRRVHSCAPGYTCVSGSTFPVTTPNNETRTYTAYVSQDLPTTGPPVVDPRGAVSVQVRNLGWNGTVGMSVDRTEVDANNTTTQMTLTLSKPVASPYFLSVYDDTGRQVHTCAPGYTCVSGSTFPVTTPNNETRTYTAYVSQDLPTTGPPVVDPRGAVSVQVRNLGWNGTVGMSVDRTEVDANNTTTQMTLTLSKPVVSPYFLSVYDNTGRRVHTCAPGYTCVSGSTFPVTTPNNETRTYTAYVSQDLPTTGPPALDVRGPVSAVVSNVGWSGIVSIRAASTYVDANSATTQMTVTLSKPVVSPYFLSVYDNTGRRVHTCAPGYTCVSGSTFPVTTPNNETRTYTAYVSQDLPTTGPPALDVRGGVFTTVTNQGWTGVIEMSVDRSVVDANDPTTRVTLALSKPVVSPYFLTVYDNTGRRVHTCAPGYTCVSGSTFPVTTPNNETRTYTAYVSQDLPTTGPPALDVRSPVSLDVVNVGWTGSVRLSRGARTATTQALTVTPSRPIAGPYIMSVYDDTGRRLFTCGPGYTCASGTTIGVGVSGTASRTYVAYVAQDVPRPGPPRNDVRAISGVYSSAGYGPTEGGETATGSNPSQECSQRCHADPINSVTGEFWETTADLEVPGVSPALRFGRSYGISRSAIDGPLGYGWTHGFDMRLAIRVGATGDSLEEASQVEVRQENGSVVIFSRLSNGTYVGPERTFASFTRNADGTYTLVRQGRQRFTFDASGRLITLGDLNGNTVSLTYDGEKLTRATHNRGGHLQLTWSGDHISSVADHTGRTVSYTYSTAGELAGVRMVDGATKGYSYDSQHRVTALTHAGGGETRNEYDASGRVTKQTDPLGRETTFSYAQDQTTITDPTGSVTIERYTGGQVISETKAAGTTIEATTYFTYGPTNQVESVTDPLGRLTRFTYDARGNRTSVTDALGRVATTVYDQLNNPLVATNAAGEKTTFTYDESGNLLTATGPGGGSVRYTLNADGTIATVTDPTGGVTTFAYDSSGYIANVTSPDGAVATSRFDSVGRLLATTDARGTSDPSAAAQFTSTFSYDAVGRALSATDPLGGIVTTAYDAAGRPTTTTDPVGATTRREYDAADQLTAIIDAAGSRTTFAYDGAGRVREVTDAKSQRSTTTYDALGRPVDVTDPLGRTSRTEYDAGNRVVATVAPSGARTTYTYDAGDQLLSVTDATGATTTTTYDLAGRPVTVTDPDGRSATTTYDAAGRPVAVQRGDGSVVRWQYDAAGRLLAYTDAAGSVTTYTYDSAGRQTSATVGGRTTALEYDHGGLLVKATQPDGQHITYSYDALNRGTRVDYSDTTPDVTYVYDAAGRATTVTDGTGQTTMTYDVMGQVVSVNSPVGDVGYSWDVLGRLANLTYPGDQSVRHTYDAAGQLTGVHDWAGRDFAFAWTTDGQLDSTTYPNGVVTEYDHDATGKTLAVTTTAADGTTELLDLGYSYSPAGLLTEQVAERPGGARAPPSSTSGYSFDALSRLSGITGHGAGAVTYDAAGSPTTLDDGRTLAYDAARQLTQITDPATGTSTTFAYDSRGNRVDATSSTGHAPATASHGYNLANQLTTLTSTTGATTQYDYSFTGLRASATEPGGDTEHYVWDTLSGVPLLLADATHAYLYGPSSVPLAQVSLASGEVDYLHSDLIRSVRTTTNDLGEVTGDTDYDTYGQPRPTSEAPTSLITRFGYAGEYTDPSGCLYLRNRYYDPRSGQFLTRDPLEHITRNPYNYTSGNPLQYTDPLGLWDWQSDLSAATTTAIMVANPALSAVLGVGDWDDANGENLLVNALQSYAVGAANAVVTMIPNTLALAVNNSILGIAAQLSGGATVPYWTAFSNPNCDDLYGATYLIGEIVGPHLLIAGPVSAGLRGAANAGRASASTAAKAAAGAADHVVLGKSIGLTERAAKIGGRHLMNDNAWRDSVLKAIRDPNTKISVALDGAEGSSTYTRVAYAALRGSQGKGAPFDWEMNQLMQSGRLPSVSFYEGGVSVANPFG